MKRHMAVLGMSLCLAGNAHAGKKNKKKAAPEPAPEPEVQVIEQATAELTGGSEGTGDPVVLPCAWEEGLAFDYAYESVKRQQRYGQDNPIVMKMPITVSVIQAGEPQTLRYLGGEPEITGPEEAIAPIKAAAEGLPPMPLDVVLAEGILTGLANFDALLPTMEILIERLTKGQPEAASTQIRAMYTDPATAPAMLLKDPARFFSMHCAALRDGQRIEADTQVPTALGTPVAARSILWVDEIDRDAGTLTVKSEDRMDPESIKALSIQFAARLVPSDADQAMIEAAMAQMPPIDSTTTGTFVMSIADGFPMSMTVQQTIGADGHPGRQTETWTWTRN